VDDFDAFCEAVYGPEEPGLGLEHQHHRVPEGQASYMAEQRAGQQGPGIDRTSSGENAILSFASRDRTRFL
jgi:hypothetical protein